MCDRCTAAGKTRMRPPGTTLICNKCKILHQRCSLSGQANDPSDSDAPPPPSLRKSGAHRKRGTRSRSSSSTHAKRARVHDSDDEVELDVLAPTPDDDDNEGDARRLKTLTDDESADPIGGPAAMDIAKDGEGDGGEISIPDHIAAADLLSGAHGAEPQNGEGARVAPPLVGAAGAAVAEGAPHGPPLVTNHGPPPAALPALDQQYDQFTRPILTPNMGPGETLMVSVTCIADLREKMEGERAEGREENAARLGLHITGNQLKKETMALSLL